MTYASSPNANFEDGLSLLIGLKGCLFVTITDRLLPSVIATPWVSIINQPRILIWF